MYKVIKHFTDLHDNDHIYNVGDEFPRDGVEVKQERIDELAGSDNKQQTPLIEKVEVTEAVPETPKEPKKPAIKKSGVKTSEK